MKKQMVVLFGLLLTCMGTQAQYVTGSPTIRPLVIDAIESLFAGGAPTNVITRGDLDEHQAKYSILQGTISGQATSVYCLWSSSDAGLEATAGGLPIADSDFNGCVTDRIIPDAPAYFLKSSVSGRSASLPSATETNTTVTTPDLTLADTCADWSYTPANAVAPVQGPNGNANGILGVVPFVWVKCTNSAPFATWSRINNVSHPQLWYELGEPQVAAFFTGVATDTNFNVYVIGGNLASGVRINAMIDTSYYNPTTHFLYMDNQFVVDPAGTNQGVFNPYGYFTGGFDPTIPGYIVMEVCNSGDDTGDEISKMLSLDGCAHATDPLTLNTGVIMIGYLDIHDALTNSMGTNLWLTLDGVTESDDAVAQGAYTLWDYEHLYMNPTADKTFANTLFTAIQNQIAGNGPGKHSVAISLQYMECAKGSCDAFPIPK